MATRKRRNGQGSIRQRGPDLYQLVYTITSGTGDGRAQGYETVKGSRKDAERRLREILASLDHGTHVEPSKDTTSAFVSYWFKTYAEPRLSPRTLRDYRGDIRRYIDPLIGNILVRDLGPQHILGMLGQMRARGLSENTLLHAYTLLHQALAHGVKWRKLAHNPCALVDRPKVKRIEMHTIDEEGVGRFFQAIADSPYADVYRLGFFTGARRSEILGLRWPSVDLDGRGISVVAGLHRIKGEGLVLLNVKTDKSRRRIPIPPTVVDTLRAIRGRQIEVSELTLGVAWNPEGYVFAKVDGAPYNPDAVTRDFTARMRTARLPITVHGLRHSFASLQLARGEHLKVVQELLGHSSASVTADLYSHVIPGIKEASVDRFAEQFNDPTQIRP